HDLNIRKLFGDDVLEALFTLHGGRAARRIHQHGDLPFAVDQLGQLAGAHLPALVVVSGDEGEVVVGVDAGIEDGDEDTGFGGALDGLGGRGRSVACDGEPIDVAGGHEGDT